MATVQAVCVSKEKGTQKVPVESARLRPDWGIEGDAHAGHWHRQVSLLASEKIDDFRSRGANVNVGDFGENIIIEGCDPRTLPVGTRFRIGDALLEMTQIGKECHTHCAIYRQVGDCIMPREGVFARVLEGGTVKAGDPVETIPPAPDRPYQAAVVMLVKEEEISDRGIPAEERPLAAGGDLAAALLREAGLDVVETLVYPKGEMPLKQQLIRLADQRQLGLILTLGGSGCGKADVTPDVTAEICERMLPGIADAIRTHTAGQSINAVLSRSVAGIRGRTLIVNLPGSKKAVEESLSYILPALLHGARMLRAEAEI